MGAQEYHPFPRGGGETAPPLHSQAALLEMAELLELVRYWRIEAERLAHDYAWIANQNRRRHEAKA